jgi:hypothetical protein
VAGVPAASRRSGRGRAEITVFDPDLDPDGTLAHSLTDTLVTALP